MSFFRSEEIVLKRIRMPGNIPNAVKLMNLIYMCDQDYIEFIDLTKDDIESKKNFQPMIKRCEDMEGKISSFEKFAIDYGMSINTYDDFTSFANDLLLDQKKRNLYHGEYFDTIENEVLEEEKKMIELFETFNKIKEDFLIETQRKQVMQRYFTLTNDNPIQSENIQTIFGICDADVDLKMKRMLFRAGRDKVISTFDNVELPKNMKQSPKKMFIIFVPKGEYLLDKILKICDVFNCILFEPVHINQPHDINKFINDINEKIENQKRILTETKQTIQNFLLDKIIKTKTYAMYKLYFQKEKHIYINLNKCILRDNFIDGEVWIVKKHCDKIRYLLTKFQDESSTAALIDLIDKGIDKPTYIPTNEFTYSFQQIVNLYGIPSYREINPGYFIIVTFPFLFGIMFGDIGHGLLLLILSIYMCMNDNNKGEHGLLTHVIKYKWFLLLCAVFSTFCGFIYNDFLSIPLNLFGTCYTQQQQYDTMYNNVYYYKENNCTYPFGIDPKWNVATNDLTYLNSIKMKFSIIIGVIQMIFGIILSGMNHIHLGNYIDFVFEFIPQLIFMCVLFGYMLVMIYYKWLTDWSGDPSKAPSIITIMINIFIKNGSVGDKPIWHKDVFDQEQYHKYIILICICLIIVMLLPKPIIKYFKHTHKRSYKRDENLLNEPGSNDNILLHRSSLNNSSVVLDPNTQFSYLYDLNRNKHSIKYEEKFIDYFIYQLITTIEFTLSTVSNTASYLRLWALSLAHAELSRVFIEKTFMDVIRDGDMRYGVNVIVVFVAFFIFANITIFILMFMDGLECALHTLRLHWVEFQNKFFKAEGYAFHPFSFKYVIDKDK